MISARGKETPGISVDAGNHHGRENADTEDESNGDENIKKDVSVTESNDKQP